MTTTTSFFDKSRFTGLYKSTFRQNIGYLVFIGIFMLIFYPFQYAMEIFKTIPPEEMAVLSAALLAENPFQPYMLYGLGKSFTPVSTFLFSAILLLAPLVLSLVLGSYLHSKKAVDVYHAMPVRRETLLLVNGAVAMTYIAVPVLISNLLILVMQTVKFGFLPGLIGNNLLEMLGWLIAAFCIYTVTTFASVLVGTTFDTFAFSGALLAAPPAVCGLGIMLASQFLLGYNVETTMMFHLLNLSPATVMLARFAFEAGLPWEMQATMRNSNVALLVWLVIGIVLVFLTMKLYHRRGSEQAENVTSKGPLPMVVKFIGTMIAAVCTGILFYEISANGSDMSFIMWAIIGGILGYAILEVILNRGFKTLVASLPLGALMVAVTVGGSSLLLTGGLGFETRIPQAAQIASAEISYFGLGYTGIDIGPALTNDPKGERAYRKYPNAVKLSDPDAIAAVLEYHQSAVDQHVMPQNVTMVEQADIHYPNTTIQYILQNGKRITRHYSGVRTETLGKLSPLDTNPEFIPQVHSVFYVQAENIIDWTISGAYGAKTHTQTYSVADSQALLTAMQNDLLATTQEQLKRPTQPPVAYLRFSANLPMEAASLTNTWGEFLVTADTPQTLQFLEKKGLLEQLAPDMNQCYAVSVEPIDMRRGSIDTAIAKIEEKRGFTMVNLEDIRRDIENFQDYMADHPEMKDQLSLSNTERRTTNLLGETSITQVFSTVSGYLCGIFEDPADIAKLADLAVGSYTVEEPLLLANFYFKDTARGISVILPVSRLPEELRTQIMGA